MTDLHELQISIKKRSPKPDPIFYRIETVADIFAAVNVDNLDGFIADFKAILHTAIFLRDWNDKNIRQGIYPDDQKIELNNFVWIDD